MSFQLRVVGDGSPSCTVKDACMSLCPRVFVWAGCRRIPVSQQLGGVGMRLRSMGTLKVFGECEAA
jgi:hypothetical protein